MKKELIENNCQFCKHSAKTYLRIGNSLVLKDAAFCMNADLTAKQKKKRLKNKEKCEHFEPAEILKQERTSDVQMCIKAIRTEIDLMEKLLLRDEDIKDK